ncbi:hypothetical protein TIFTF001_023560 [Ficus carica]|uniref:Uncharacterized protein n=1 Tax=Ficus carica TaxID=3494 RepID=A0AA88DDW0_FICCA|nr:hypothetical protein TIFTF001_023560 [Ficus carica]
MTVTISLSLKLLQISRFPFSCNFRRRRCPRLSQSTGTLSVFWSDEVVAGENEWRFGDFGG